MIGKVPPTGGPQADGPKGSDFSRAAFSAVEAIQSSMRPLINTNAKRIDTFTKSITRYAKGVSERFDVRDSRRGGRADKVTAPLAIAARVARDSFRTSPNPAGVIHLNGKRVSRGG